MQVTFFPANKLNATVCPIYNGHTAIVSHNTDRLIDGKYSLAELMAFKHNVQCTSFLHAFGDTTAGENVNYGDTIKAVHNTGRISFGLYWRSDMWINPRNGNQETIPDHNSSTWTANGKSYYPDVTVGASKTIRYPNHGQQLYDLSNGEFGYDAVNQVMGASNLSETYLHTDQQLDHIKGISGLQLTSASYTNGASSGWNVLIPKFFGVRNSAYGYSGNNGNIKYVGLTRPDMMIEPSTCRGWDAANAGQFPNQTAALNYSASEIARSIASGGWFSEFMHWHSLYNASDTAFFEPFMQMIDTAIGNSDVWRAGNNQVNEYYVLANSIAEIGSYVDANKAYVAIRLNDMFIGTNTNGINNAIDPTKIETPISIQFDLTGTSLEGKLVKSSQAVFLRSLGGNKWIANVRPVNTFKNGFINFSVEEALDNKQVFAISRPVITRSGNDISTDRECKFVVYRKLIGSDDSTYEWVFRTTELSSGMSYIFDTATYSYAVGAITRSRMSSLISF